MADEIEYVREVCGWAAPGPWRAVPDGEGWAHILNGQRHRVIAGAGEASAPSIALLGSTWRETLAVIEAAITMRRAQKERGPYCVQEACDVEDALEAFRAAVRAHRDRLHPPEGES